MKILSGFMLSTVILTAPLLGSEVRFNAPSPDKVIVSGIKHLATSMQSAISPDSIISLLENGGYFGSTIRTDSQYIIVTAGDRFTVGDISAEIVQSDGSIVARNFPEYSGQVASRGVIENIKTELINKFQVDGYYFASLTVDSVAYSDNRLNLELRIITGPEVIIARTRFRGPKKTNIEFLKKICAIKEHRPLIAKDVENAVRRLSAVPYLEIDSLPQIIPNESYDEVELLFAMTELKANSVEFGGGYLPEQGDKPSQIVGHFHFQSANLFGHGREVDLLLDRKDRESSLIRFAFVQPLFIPDHLRLGVRFEQVDYDSSYYSFSAGLSASLISAGSTEIGGALDWNRIRPQFLPATSSRTLSGKIFYNFNSFDYRYNPSRGHSTHFSAAYLRRNAAPDSVSTTLIDNESIFELGWDQYIPLSGNLQIRLYGNARVRITPRELIDFAEQFKLGGSQSLRGYREEEFAGRRTGLVQAEVRMRTSRFFAGYVFGDYGYIYSVTQSAPNQIRAGDVSRVGYGAGLFAGSTNARVKIEFGWGEGDSFADGKLHITFGAIF